MQSSQPIGLFDSGIGGISIWKEVRSLLPGEDTIYLADSRNAPYGQRPKSEIISLSRKNTELLLDLGCKIIIVACNTATTNAIRELRESYTVPFIGIEPAIRPAALHSSTQIIGILATKGTLSSELFNKAVELYQETTIVEQVGHGIVELIETGRMHSPEMTALLHKYLDPMVKANIDYLVLGCSHYPFLIPQIRKILPEGIKIIDSGEAVARQTKNVLEAKNLLSGRNSGSSIFYTNGDPEIISSLLGPGFTATYRDF